MKIISLNVNGIQNTGKRNTIFNWLQNQNADLYLLQETHCNSKNDETKWALEWGGSTFWSNGTNFSCGV